MRNIAVVLMRLARVVIVTAFVVQSSVQSAPAAALELAEAEAELGFEPSRPPKPLPEIRFTDIDGRPLTLADFHGRLVLLNFWATWCAPCVREMPSLDHLQQTLGGPDFEVVAVSLDRGGAAKVMPFFVKHDIKHLRKYLDPASRGAFAVKAVGLPTTLLVDREGRTLGRVSGPAEWDSEAALALVRHYLDGSTTTATASE